MNSAGADVFNWDIVTSLETNNDSSEFSEEFPDLTYYSGSLYSQKGGD